MGLHDMSQARLRSFLTALIWGVAAVGFGLTFFSAGGPEGFSGDRFRHLAGAVALAFGFLGGWTVLWFTRQRKGAPPVYDERDRQVQAQANQAALMGVLMGNFALAIGLWTLYEGAGQVPAGWLWFLAYGSVILAHITSSVAFLILDGRTAGNG